MIRAFENRPAWSHNAYRVGAILICLSSIFVQPSAAEEPERISSIRKSLAQSGNRVGIPRFRPSDFGDQSALPTPERTASNSTPNPDPDPIGTDIQPSREPAKGEQPVAPEPARPQRRSTKEADVITPAEDDLVTTSPVINDTCLNALSQHADVVRAAQVEASDQACTIPDPVELISVKGKFPIKFTSGLILDCDFATKMVSYLDMIVQPLARHHMGEPLTRLHSGQGFVCRRRNNALTGKLSEHAFGNAMDLVSYEFASGRRLPIREASEMEADEAAFFTGARKASCGLFTTVLGPGSNDAHATHLHLDLGRAKEKKNPHRICD